jgi:hypothetical protein
MAESTEEIDEMFPRLDDAQIERLRPSNRMRNAGASEVLYEQGDATPAFRSCSKAALRNQVRARGTLIATANKPAPVASIRTGTSQRRAAAGFLRRSENSVLTQISFWRNHRNRRNE